jgi:hypothetical protein
MYSRISPAFPIAFSFPVKINKKTMPCSQHQQLFNPQVSCPREGGFDALLERVKQIRPLELEMLFPHSFISLS